MRLTKKFCKQIDIKIGHEMKKAREWRQKTIETKAKGSFAKENHTNTHRTEKEREWMQIGG